MNSVESNFEFLAECDNTFLQRPIEPPTFMEVLGNPHWENVWSNILAFFLDDSNGHGMKNLWAKSLLECAKKKSPSGCDKYENDISNIDAIREYHTKKGKSIDILVHGDNYVIGIENKVYSGVHNPLDDYVETIDKEAKGTEAGLERTPVYILLTLCEVSEKELRENSRNHEKWINVLYNDYFEQILDNFGKYMDEADEKWTIFMKDFIKTAKKRIGGGENMKLDSDTVKFMKEKENDISKFLDWTDDVKASLKSKVVEIRREIERTEDIRDLYEYSEGAKVKRLKVWDYSPVKSDLYACTGIDVKFEGGKRTLVAEIILDYEWRIFIWERDHEDDSRGREILDDIKEIAQNEDDCIREITNGAKLNDRDNWKGRVLLLQRNADEDCTTVLKEYMRVAVKLVVGLAEKYDKFTTEQQ